MLHQPKEGEKTFIAIAYTETGTDLNTKYGYRVKAKIAHGRSDVSNFARIDS